MKNELLVNPIEFGLEVEKSNELTNDLNPILAERNVLSESYKLIIGQEITPELLTQSRELRLKIQKNRTQGIEKWHKATKDFFLTGGRFVDAIKNKAIVENVRMEDNLIEIEKHFENIEKKRIQDLQDLRIELVRPYLESVENLVLSNMENDVFDAYLKTKKEHFEAEQEAEKKAELNRLEAKRLEKERIENQRIENERLKKEAEEKDAELKAIQEKNRIENERIEKENAEKLRLEREKSEKLRLENEEKLKVEREKQAKIEAELQAKKDAELKAENEHKAIELQAKKDADKLAKAPIKLQLNSWVNSFEIPTSNFDNELKNEITEKFVSFKKRALSQVESL